jgi:hypothetical protein
MSLERKLEKQRQVSHKRIPVNNWETMQRAAQDLARSGITEKCLKAGATAPDFDLPNAHGKSVSLQGLLKTGPVVLSFYRGGW